MPGATEQDLAGLMVTLQADFTRYRNDMQKMVEITKKAATESERAAVGANDNISKSFQRSADSATRSIRAVRGESANMAAQFQDVATQLQGGGNPFTVAIQQGQQLGAVLTQIGQGGGMLGVVKGLGQAALTALNPWTLLSVGIIYAIGKAVEYFTSTEDGADKSTKALENQVAVLQEITKAYQDLNPALAQVTARLAEMGKARLGAGNLAEARDLIAQPLQEPGTKLARAIPALASQFMPGDQDRQAVADIAKVFKELPEDIKNGTASVEDINKAFDDLIALMDKMDPKAVGVLLKQLPELRALFVQTAKDVEPVNQQISDLKLPPDFQPNLEEVNKQMAILKSLGVPAVDDLTKAFDALSANVKAANGDLATIIRAVDEYQRAVQGIGDINLQKVSQGIASASSDYAKLVAAVESGGDALAKNKLSSASGTFQFIDQTWLENIKRLPQYAGIADAALLKLKTDATAQMAVFNEFTARNVQMLLDAGIAATDLNKYMAHLMGAAGAIATLKADPNALISTILDPKAIASNKSLLGGGITASQAISNVQDFLNRKRRQFQPTDFEQAIDNSKELTAQTEEETAIIQKYGKDSAETAGQIARLREEEKLLKIAQKDGKEVTAEQTEEIKKSGDAAYAAGKQKQQAAIDENNLRIMQKLAAEGQKDLVKTQEELNAERKRAAEQFAELGVSFASTFINDLKEGKSAAEALRDALANLADQLLQMALKGLFTMLGNALFGVTAAGGGLVGPFGVAGPAHQVSPFAFVGAPRMARGGFVGVRPGEYPTLLHKGELVVPASMVRQAMGLGAQPSASGAHTVRNSIGSISISVNNKGDGLSTGDVKTDTERGKVMGRMILATVQSEINRQSRPGGMLTLAGSGGRVGR